jgi:hypothetical protein
MSKSIEIRSEACIETNEHISLPRHDLKVLLQYTLLMSLEI